MLLNKLTLFDRGSSETANTNKLPPVLPVQQEVIFSFDLRAQLGQL